MTAFVTKRIPSDWMNQVSEEGNRGWLDASFVGLLALYQKRL